MTINITKKRLLVGVAAVALLAGGGAAYAVATGSPAAERQAFINNVAGRLGVAPSNLENALEAAAIDRVDAAVARGELTQEQATELKNRIRSGEAPLFGLGMGHGPHGGPAAGILGRDAFVNGVADFLGITVAQLRTELEDKTLAEVARAHDKSVDGLKTAISNLTKKQLDEAVDDGKLTQAQATDLLNRINSNLDELVNRSLGGKPPDVPGGQGSFGPPGPGAFGPPPGFGAPEI